MRVWIGNWGQTDEGSVTPKEAAKAAFRSCCGRTPRFDRDVTDWDAAYFDHVSGKIAEIGWSEDEAEARGGRSWCDAVMEEIIPLQKIAD